MRAIKHINKKISLNGQIQTSSLIPSFGANLLQQDWKMLRSFFFFFSKHTLPSLSLLLLALPAVDHFYCIIALI